MEKQKKVERWSYPFKAKGEGDAASTEVVDPQVYYEALAKAESGYYPVSRNGLWHGGVHFDQNTAALLDQSFVRCIADGVVVAYRIDEAYKKLTYSGSGTPKEVTYSTGFVLVRHRLELPPVPTPATTPPATEPELTFYSLYMHLMDWASYEADPALPRPAFWTAKVKADVTDEVVGLRVRSAPKGHPGYGNILAVLPRGTLVETEAGEGNWLKVTGTTPNVAGVVGGYVFKAEMNLQSGSTYQIAELAKDPMIPEQTGLNIRKGANASSPVLAVLPKGAQVRIAPTATASQYHKLLEILGGESTPALTAEQLATDGYVWKASLDEAPQQTNAVVLVDPPLPILAGELIGHLGKYQAASQDQAHDLLHLEVFSCDNVETFVAQSRARARQLKPEQKTLLKIPSGTKVITKDGASQANPPLIADPGKPTAYDMIFPLAALNALPANRKITLTTTASGATTTEQWWYLDKLPGEDGNPLSGWVREDELITPRLHPWDWEGFDFIKETSTLGDQYVCQLSADGVLDDEETLNYTAQINGGDGGPVRTRLYQIIDVDGDEKLTPTEIKNALAKPWHAQSISRLIAQYESEWYADEGLSKWEALNGYMTKESEKDWDQEKNRIRSLLWLRDLMGSGSRLTESAWHIHPITTMACFNSSCIPLVRAQEIALLVSTGYEGKSELDFEALAGNFDQQGMSFGIIQWNFGQGTLGPVLKDMRDSDSAAFDACFDESMNLHTLTNSLNSGDLTAQFNWSTGVQSSNQAGWKQAFKNIGQVERFKTIQLKHAAKYHDNVLTCISLMREIAPQHMTSVELRTYVALYDLCVQQNNLTKAKQDIIAGYPTSNVTNQHEPLIYVCKKRAERAASAWVADCLSRRMGIILGSTYTATANGLISSRVNPNLGKIIAGTVCEL